MLTSPGKVGAISLRAECASAYGIILEGRVGSLGYELGVSASVGSLTLKATLAYTVAVVNYKFVF